MSTDFAIDTHVGVNMRTYDYVAVKAYSMMSIVSFRNCRNNISVYGSFCDTQKFHIQRQRVEKTALKTCATRVD